MAQRKASAPSRKRLPAPDGDFYMIAKTLTEDENAIHLKVRAFMEREVQPIIGEYWERDEFPFVLLPKLRELDIMGLPYKGHDCPGASHTLSGFAMLGMARIDLSIALPHRAGSGIRGSWGAAHDSPPRGQYLDFERSEEMDWQCDLGRPDGDLGARRSRWPGNRLRR
jgi:alkylation response protein AidB-like acyl-CoA dehydrogenase